MKPAIPLLTLALATGAAAMVILNRPGDGDSSPAPSSSNVSAQAVPSSGLYIYPPVEDATLTFMHSDGTVETVRVSNVEHGANGQVTVEAVVSAEGEALPVTIVTESDGGLRSDVRKLFMVDMISRVDPPAEVDVGFYGDHDYWLPSIQRMREGAVSQGNYLLSGTGDMEGHIVEVDVNVDWLSGGSILVDEIPLLRDADDPHGFDAEENDYVTAIQVGSDFDSSIEMAIDGMLISEQTMEQTVVAWIVPGFGRIYQKTWDENNNLDAMWLTESSVRP